MLRWWINTCYLNTTIYNWSNVQQYQCITLDIARRNICVTNTSRLVRKKRRGLSFASVMPKNVCVAKYENRRTDLEGKYELVSF